MCCMKSRSKHFLVIHPDFPFNSTCFFRTTCWIFRILFYITLLLLLKLNKFTNFTIVLKASSTNLMNMEVTAKPKSQTLEKIGLWTRNPTPYTLNPKPQPLKYAVGKIWSIQGKIPLVWDLIGRRFAAALLPRLFGKNPDTACWLHSTHTSWTWNSAQQRRFWL